MSASTLTKFLQNLPISWLVGGPNGQADCAAQGALYDDQISKLREAVKASFTQLCPVDALPHVGGDRKLIQGFEQSDADFRVRLLTAWEDWSRAGQAAEFLAQLYWAGYHDVLMVQQNGLGMYLSGAPTVGVDPSSLLVVTTLTPLITDLSCTSPPRSVPAGTPWFALSANGDLCSQFALILLSPPAFWVTSAKAVFDGTTDTVIATWSKPLDNTSYLVADSVYVTDGTSGIMVNETAKTQTSITVHSSGVFTGEVHLLAWQPGVNPFWSYNENDIAVLRSVIRTWRRGAASCAAIIGLVNGELWDYPDAVWDDGGLWDDGSTAISFDVTGA